LFPNTQYSVIIAAYISVASVRSPSIFMQTGVTYNAAANPNPWPTAEYSGYVNNIFPTLHGGSNTEWSTTFYGLTDFPKVAYDGSDSTTDTTEFDGLNFLIDNCASSTELEYQISDKIMTESSKVTSINTEESQSSTYTQNIQLSTTVEGNYGAASASASFTIDFGSSNSIETSKSYGTDTSVTMSDEISSGAVITVPAHAMYRVIEKLKISNTQRTHNIQINNQQNDIVQDTQQIFPGGFRSVEISCNPDRIFSSGTPVTSLLLSSLISRPSNKYFLTLQSDNNLVISCAQYGLTGIRKQLWSTNTGQGTPLAAVIYLQYDGNFVMYDSTTSLTIYATSSGGGVSPYSLLMKDDGNIAIYDKNDYVVWTTNITPNQC